MNTTSGAVIANGKVMDALNERKPRRNDAAAAKAAVEETAEYKEPKADIHRLVQLAPQRAILRSHLNEIRRLCRDESGSRGQKVAALMQR